MSTELPNSDQVPEAPAPEVIETPQDPDSAGIAAAASLMQAHQAGVDVSAPTPAASEEALDLAAAALFGEKAPEAKTEPEAKPEPEGDEPKPEPKADKTAGDDFEASIKEIEDEYGSVVAAPMRAMAAKIKALSAKVAPGPEADPVAPAQAFHDFIDANGQKYAGIIGASGKTATKDQLKRRQDVGLTASALYTSMAQQRPPVTAAEKAQMEEQAILLAMEAVADPTRFRQALQNREAAKRSSHRTHAAGGGTSFERHAPGRSAAPAPMPTKSADEAGIDIVARMIAQAR